MHVDEKTAQNALEILQGKAKGDTYEAANQLAARMEILGCDGHGDGLTNWLDAGDFEGDETIDTLVTEWNETTS